MNYISAFSTLEVNDCTEVTYIAGHISDYGFVLEIRTLGYCDQSHRLVYLLAFVKL